MVAIFFAVQIGAYRLDELAGRHCSTGITDRCLLEFAIIGITTACALGFIIMFYTGLWELLIPMFFAGIIIVAYNFDKLFKGFFHNMYWFMMSWAFIPVVATYYLHAETLNTGIIIFGIFCMLLGALHIDSYGLTQCRHSHTCLDYNPEYVINEYELNLEGTSLSGVKKEKIKICLKECHGQTCYIRVHSTPRTIYRLAWKLINRQFLMVIILTASIIYIQAGL